MSDSPRRPSSAPPPGDEEARRAHAQRVRETLARVRRSCQRVSERCMKLVSAAADPRTPLDPIPSKEGTHEEEVEK